jgi:GNAT superfamily N-acetyltransferase
MENLTIINLTDQSGALIEPSWLAKAEDVHRQLRPALPSSYAEKMARVFALGGRMNVAVRDEQVVGVAVYRVHENTADGVMMYVDDLVTDENHRSSGVGKALMDHLQQIARAAGCARYT